MAVTVTATVGGASSNSYLTVAAADTLFNNRLAVTAWTDASTDDKGRALIMATADIDALRLRGYKVDSAQALQFPRNCQDEATNTIPVAVQKATIEQALAILQNATNGGRTEAQIKGAQGITQHRLGDFSESFGNGAGSGTTGAGPVSGIHMEALKHLRGWITRSGRIIGRQETARRQNGYWWPFV